MGAPPHAPPSGALAPPAATADTVLTVLPGPRVDWFAPEALTPLSKKQIKSQELSKISPMIPGLLNALNNVEQGHGV